MFQALKTHSLILFWGCENSLFPLLALWGNKNWLPSMKVKNLKLCQTKIGLKGCKWSSLNVPSKENPLSHSFLALREFHFPIIGLRGNKNWLPSMKVKKLKICQNKIGLIGCNGSNLNAPGIENPLSHSLHGGEKTPFSHYWPTGVIRIGFLVLK